MKITYRWMKEYLTFDISPREMIDRLTQIGHEVEEVIDLGLLDNPIRTARILTVQPHPSADNLTVCTVEYGGEKPVSVVCGAPNAQEGAIAVLALAGSVLPSGLQLERTTIRGVESHGMLLAPDELGLGSDHSGLLLLDPNTTIGEGFDVIVQVAITPNRPDVLSIHGLARDLAASYGQKVYPRSSRLRETYTTIESMVKITVKAPDACPRYTARLIRGVKIGPSPQWLQLRLLAVGLRPINNVVDVTNYVLMERGHPLHAFDFDLLRRHQIVVRMANDGETISLIDGTQLELAGGEDLVIADGERPVALAGIMGGSETEVSAATENILLESAYFQPSQIRKSSMRHRISSDSSYRFERGTEQHVLTEVLDRATGLIAETSEGNVAKGTIDSQPKLPALKTIVLRTDRACQALGIDLPKTTIADILVSLGFEVVRSERENLILSVPSFRVDVSIEEDVYEEIARIYGYDKIPTTTPYLPAMASRVRPENALRRRVQDLLVGFGFSEAINLSFVALEQMEKLGMDTAGALRLLNPLSKDQAALRSCLATSLIQNVIHNQSRGNTDLALFELGKTYHFGDAGQPYKEIETLGLAMAGACRPASWRESAGEADFYLMKGTVEQLLECLGIPLDLQEGGAGFLHPGRRAELVCEGKPIGWLGELNPKHAGDLDVKGRLQLAEIRLDLLLGVSSGARKVPEISRFPASERDLAIVLDRSIPAATVESVIRAEAGKLLEGLRLFDCYTGPQVAEDKKSLAYRIVYRDREKTLTDQEVEVAQGAILHRLKSECGATLRS